MLFVPVFPLKCTETCWVKAVIVLEWVETYVDRMFRIFGRANKSYAQKYLQWSFDIMNLCVTKCSIRQTIFFIPVIVKCVKKNRNIMKPRFSKQILPVPCPFVMSRFHCSLLYYYSKCWLCMWQLRNCQQECALLQLNVQLNTMFQCMTV